MLTMTVRCRLD